MEKNKILSLEDRIPKIREHRRKKANRRLIFILTLFFLLIAIIVYFQSPLSHVDDIKISGNYLSSEEKIKEITKIEKGISLFKVEKKAAESELKKIPYIKTAKVSTHFPNDVKISIEEYTPVGYLYTEDHVSIVLETGNVIDNKTVKTKLSDYPLMYNFTEDHVLTKLTNELSKLPKEILNVISEIHYAPKETDEFHIYMYTNDGYEVNATIPTLASKFSNYSAIVSQLDPHVKGVIDLEVGAFFKAYDEGEKKNEQTKKD